MKQDQMAVAYKRILVPFDGSGGSQAALRKALLLARSFGSEVTVISVDEHTPRYAPGVGKVEEEKELRALHFAALREQAVTMAREAGIEIQTVEKVGHAAQAILDHACDCESELIVIGHSGHSRLWGSLLGSTTARVVDHAQCDVLVVR